MVPTVFGVEQAGPAAAGRTGRRPGNPDTRMQILRVAAEAFLRDGFDAVSVRSIARAAGVDQALVHRYFGTKRDLFVASLRLGFDAAPIPAKLAAGGRDGIGARLMSTVTGVWESPAGAVLVSTVRQHPGLTAAMAGYVNEPIVEAVMGSWGVNRREAELRAGLVETQLIGLVQARFVVGIEPIASLRARN